MADLATDRYFDPTNRDIAVGLYETVRDLPLICPHGHVDPAMFSAPHHDYGTPVDLLIIPDHYIFRMLYSQGIPLDELGIRPQDGDSVEKDHRKIWQTFADHWYLFRGTPTGIWLRDELAEVFGVTAKLCPENAQEVYDQITDKLSQPNYQPRALYERFNIEVLATTDPATSTLSHHQAIRDSGWSGCIVPNFRPDAVVNLDTEGWINHIHALSEVSGIEVHDYRTFVAALEQRREFFKHLGATATDHAAQTAYTEHLSDQDANAIFQLALKGNASDDDVRRFTGHMLIEMARMSTQDNLVMQLHIGSYRNHNPSIFERFGRDMGADIPITSEFTRNLKPLLDNFGNNPSLTIIIFNLDETTYSRELAPLAGHYHALRLGPPWWFFDSLYGMRRFFETVIETAGIYNTVGFNDDTRAYPSIPARHDVWRRACADWLAGLVARRIIDQEDALEMIAEMAYGLAKKAYRFDF